MVNYSHNSYINKSLNKLKEKTVEDLESLNILLDQANEHIPHLVGTDHVNLIAMQRYYCSILSTLDDLSKEFMENQ